MLRHLLPLSILALFALGAPVAAQEAPADPAEAAPEAPAEAPETEATPDAAPPAAGTEAPAEGAVDPETGLAMGEPVAGQPYIREEFGDWQLRCLAAEEGPDPCQLYQLLLDADGNAVAEISMFPLPDDQEAAAGATIVAPLETLLTAELTLSVDGTGARRYPFTFCNRAGCVARVGFTADEVQQFRSGNAAQMSIVPAAAPDQRVELTISLSGFTAGFDVTTSPPPEE